MVPTPIVSQRRTAHLFVTSLAPILAPHARNLANRFGLNVGFLHGAATDGGMHTIAKRAVDSGSTEFIVFACLIPVLVLLSGMFAGLTLGYMSLDETQLNVLSISGTPKQQEYANKIKPVRKDGHLLLITLILANMIVNETLPVIADPVLGGGVQSVVVSTVLIVIFSEIIPQSVCTRHGLAIGATMAPFVRVLILALGIVAWPVAKLLELILGPHHGIIYRRSELKELINMHSNTEAHGGDLKRDTVTIIGHTLDLQEKVVKHAMTPIEKVFMLSIESKLDYDTLRKISVTGHSRIPVYEEITVPVAAAGGTFEGRKTKPRVETVKKIIGILLVKHCVMLDPNDAVPLRKIPLNRVTFVPQNEPLLGILDRFQEGRSHMAIVTRYSKETAASVKKVVKKDLTQRIKNSVGLGDSDSSDEEEAAEEKNSGRGGRVLDPEMGGSAGVDDGKEQSKSRRNSIQLTRVNGGREQSMPADAVLNRQGVQGLLQTFDPAVMPLGIITLEDVLEELIGEEIYDEFDPEGAHADLYSAARADPQVQTDPGSTLKHKNSAPDLCHDENISTSGTTIVGSGTGLKNLSSIALPHLKNLNPFARSRSAPPTPRDTDAPQLPVARQPSTAVRREQIAGDVIKEAGSDETLPQPTPVHAAATLPQIVVDYAGVLPPPTERDWDSSPAPPTSHSESHSPLPPSTPVAGDFASSDPSSLPVPAASPIPRILATGSLTPTRSASPAPSLEAFLHERRRGRAPPGYVVYPTPSPVASSGSLVPSGQVVKTPSGGGKGGRFKSSLLGGGDLGGVVVADHVRRDLQGSGTENVVDGSTDVGGGLQRRISEENEGDHCQAQGPSGAGPV